MIRACLLLCSLLLAPPSSAGQELRIAVAANFAGTFDQLSALYSEQHPGVSFIVTSGASGKHYAQISQGAPFDLFFSADDRMPAELAANGHALEQTRTAYAEGVLALWSGDPGRLGDQGADWLRGGEWRRIAVANPRVAPYGAAAMAVLDGLGIETGRGRVVTGQSVGQAFAFASSGNADAAFVALSQVIGLERQSGPGSRWLPEPDSYPPIRQEAVVLRAARDPRLAHAFLDWVLSDARAQAVIRDAGYRLPE
ncbi:MAG: molybdate ABC transporter substrate-binding protein [Chromatiales bacterium]|nr:molybdate ABC transporter substrate-binding protein [Chromatiales bacterium]